MRAIVVGTQGGGQNVPIAASEGDGQMPNDGTQGPELPASGLGQFLYEYYFADIEKLEKVYLWLREKKYRHNEPLPSDASLDELDAMRQADEARWAVDLQVHAKHADDAYKRAMQHPPYAPEPTEFSLEGMPLTPAAEKWYAEHLKPKTDGAGTFKMPPLSDGPVLTTADERSLSDFFANDPVSTLIDTIHHARQTARTSSNLMEWHEDDDDKDLYRKFADAARDARQVEDGFLEQLRVVSPELGEKVAHHVQNLGANAPAPDHYDDGHAFGWKQPDRQENWANLTGGEFTPYDRHIEDVEAKQFNTPDDDEPPKPVSSSRKWAAVGGTLAVLLAVAVAIPFLLGGGDDDDADPAAADDRTEETVAPRDDAVPPTAVPTVPVVPALVPACDLLSADAVGAIVGRNMVSENAVAGVGCTYTTTDTPDIDVTTAYPPFVNQVVVTYNAANGTLTGDAVEDMFASGKPADATDVGGIGDGAYTTGTSGGATALDDGVMVIVNIGSTRRPESLGEVQGMSQAIVDAFFAAYPR